MTSGEAPKRPTLDYIRGRTPQKKTATCAVCGQTLHPSLKKGQWAHSKKADHAPKPSTPK